MPFRYLREEEQAHWKAILRALVPRALLLLRAKLRYRRWFPGASITPASTVARGARLGRHVVIHDASVGGTVTLGDFSTLGANSTLSGGGAIEIGKFCSIGPDCFLRSDNHVHEAITTYPLAQLLEGAAGVAGSFKPAPIQLGHDVWMGRGVTVLAGARIGAGCIVAAGCVVPAGDYPPYSILGGVPARVLKARFPEATIARLLADPWWDWPDEAIFRDRRETLLTAPAP